MTKNDPDQMTSDERISEIAMLMIHALLRLRMSDEKRAGASDISSYDIARNATYGRN